MNKVAMPASEPKDEYTIGDLAACCGASQRTLRFYEERELLRPARRGGQRIFAGKDRVRLELIILAKRLGFSLAEIWNLIHSRRFETDEIRTEPPCVEWLGLTREEIRLRLEALFRERERVQRALEDLQTAAARGTPLLPRPFDPSLPSR